VKYDTAKPSANEKLSAAYDAATQSLYGVIISPVSGVMKEENRKTNERRKWRNGVAVM